jgi:hypothetical protein
MPLSLRVGLNKKIGLPNYSSLGASCHVEIELESQLLNRDPEGFQGEVRRAYAACASALQEELARQTPARNRGADPESSAAAGALPAVGSANGHSEGGAGASGRIPFSRRPATGPQLRAIAAISQRLSLDLLQELRLRFGVEEAGALTVGDASRFIDELQLLAAERGAEV